MECTGEPADTRPTVAGISPGPQDLALRAADSLRAWSTAALAVGVAPDVAAWRPLRDGGRHASAERPAAMSRQP